ncbi:PRD domain-containing protein [Actinomycetaceae bacterium L2_0104]
MTAPQSAPRLVIRRVFNNSAVLAVDPSGAEQVLLGRGIGFHLRPDDEVDPARIDKTFVLTNPDTITRYSALLSELSEAEVDLASEVIIRARERLGEHVSAHVLLPLSDHINFAVRRAREGASELDYELRWEVQHLYPNEVGFSHEVIDLIESRLGVRIPAAEATPLALHFVNARLSAPNMGDTIRSTRVLGKVLEIVREDLAIDVDENSVDVARLVWHLRYLSSDSQAQLAPVAPSVYETVRDTQPDEHAVALRIGQLLNEELGVTIREQDVLFLTLHVTRLHAASRARRADP